MSEPLHDSSTHHKFIDRRFEKLESEGENTASSPLYAYYSKEMVTKATKHDDRKPEFTSSHDRISSSSANISYFKGISAIYEELIKGKKAVSIRSLETKENDLMDWQQRYMDKLDRDFGEMKDSLRATEDRIARNIEQSMAEMRDRDNQRHTEFLSIKNEFSELRTELADSKRWNLGTFLSIAALALAAIIGIVTVALR